MLTTVKVIVKHGITFIKGVFAKCNNCEEKTFNKSRVLG